MGMSANTRRAELIRLLISRRQDTVPNLAIRFCVSEKTIRRDLMELTAQYPIVTVPGNGGGVRLEEWYRPYKRLFTREQCAVLRELILIADERQTVILVELLDTYGSAG